MGARIVKDAKIMFLPALALLAQASLWGSPAMAADAPSKRKAPEPPAAEAAIPQVPGDDIFGFTTPSDTGNVGDTQFFNENDGRLGKRDGRYLALNQKFAIGRTIAENWVGAVALFGAYNRARNVTGINDIDSYQFDGISLELEHRFVERSATMPVALSWSVEPRWGRVDGGSGSSTDYVNANFKLFADMVIVPDKLFLGANLNFQPQSGQDPNFPNRWINTSQTLVSAALTWQAAPNLFIGAESRYLATYNRPLPVRNTGQALYIGPTMLWKITDKVAFNATYQPQVAGRASANPDLRLDLDNFEKAQFRAKLVVQF